MLETVGLIAVISSVAAEIVVAIGMIRAHRRGDGATTGRLRLLVIALMMIVVSISIAPSPGGSAPLRLAAILVGLGGVLLGISARLSGRKEGR